MNGNGIQYSGCSLGEAIWEPSDTLEVLREVIEHGMPGWLWLYWFSVKWRIGPFC